MTLFNEILFLAFTMFCAIIDHANERIVAVSCGHPPALLFQAGQVRPLEQAGGPIGLLPTADVSWNPYEGRFTAADRLLVYSDGVTETMNSDGQLFEEARLHDLVIDHAQAQPGAIAAAVIDAVDAWRGEADVTDDCTVLVAGCRSDAD